ncbi:hypothetical protein J5N97_016739 [Dioscorea zingiberensis]|uniref:Uncharacterized protein n=1 Tax=Dioscorea zingiberensis TaxID=325984 RepID=A0A9D5CKS9_9LILI|nr:hypothetical protein J5N97_016739 [Dioscorea zingiberensis]
MKNTLLDLVHRRGEEENFVKLLVVYLMGVFLFPTTNCTAPSWSAHYADNLQALGTYAWAQAVHKFLMDDVQLISARVVERCSGKKPKNTGLPRGRLSIVLIMQFYEVIFGKKSELRRTPRILCYGETSCKKTTIVKTLIASFEGKEFQDLVPENAEEASLTNIPAYLRHGHGREN